MNEFVDEMLALSISAARAGDRAGSKQILELVLTAQRAQIEQIKAIFDQMEQIDRLIDRASMRVFGERSTEATAETAG